METLQVQIKPTVSVYRAANKIYFKSAGYCTEVDDENGFVTKLCSLLDGERQTKSLFDDLSKEYPQLTMADLTSVLSTLNDAYFLENSHVPTDSLDEYDLIRWSRNINFFGSYCKAEESKYAYQAKLKSIKVTLLGVGGLGSHILYDLVALGVHDIRAVDFDKIELSNLNRQILYSESDIGRLKTEAAADRIRQFNSKAKVEFVNKKLSSADDIAGLIEDRDIVICVADKPRMQVVTWLNEACVKKNIPFINGGLDVQRAVFYSVVPGKSGCVECWQSGVKNNDELSRMIIDEDTKRDTGTGIPDPAIVTLVTTLTGLMLSEFIKFATDIMQPTSIEKLISVHFDTMQTSIAETWTKNPSCRICGK